MLGTKMAIELTCNRSGGGGTEAELAGLWPATLRFKTVEARDFASSSSGLFTLKFYLSALCCRGSGKIGEPFDYI